MAKNYDFSELRTIININSYTKNRDGVNKNGEIFSTWMREIGYEVKKYQRVEIGDHLHFISKKVKGKKILLLGHLDTVFPEGSFDDFREDENWIYGPGVCDMKGGNFVSLEALRNIKKSSNEITNIDMFI